MEKKQKIWGRFFDPLYFPLVTAIPIEVWLLFKDQPLKQIEVVLYIIGILFLVFSGAVETFSEETKDRVVGYIYLVSSLVFGTGGLWMWMH